MRRTKTYKNWEIKSTSPLSRNLSRVSPSMTSCDREIYSSRHRRIHLHRPLLLLKSPRKRSLTRNSLSKSRRRLKPTTDNSHWERSANSSRACRIITNHTRLSVVQLQSNRQLHAIASFMSTLRSRLRNTKVRITYFWVPPTSQS